jgi:hypothetical protein
MLNNESQAETENQQSTGVEETSSVHHHNAKPHVVGSLSLPLFNIMRPKHFDKKVELMPEDFQNKGSGFWCTIAKTYQSFIENLHQSAKITDEEFVKVINDSHDELVNGFLEHYADSVYDVQ